MLVIVPNAVSQAINNALDMAIKECPEAEGSRDALYHELLQYFDENGVIPDFSLCKKIDTNDT